MLLSHWLYVTNGEGVFVGDNLWGFIGLDLWCREATKSRYERSPNSSSPLIFQFLFTVLFLITMVLDTLSLDVIPVILQKLLFKQNNDCASDQTIENHSESKSVGVGIKEDDNIKSCRKKCKKRRRREKRKITACSNDGDLPGNIYLNDPEDDVVESEEEFLDVNSAFVSLAVSRKKVLNQGSLHDGSQTVAKDANDKKVIKVHDEKSEAKYVAASERLAIQGCKLADKEHYEHSIDMFSKAIELNPIDYRFYGNRSFCFFQLGDYKRALKDADKAISLAPENPKGYFRKGEALKALKKFKGAKTAFEHVLKLDDDCEDARLELQNVKQLLEISFKGNANQGVGYEDNGQSFGNPVNSGGIINHGDLANDGVDMKMDPSNPNGFSSLWIGNISAAVTEQMLSSIFSRYGIVSSVRILPKKYCAFINFLDASSAGLAMKNLQRSILCGERILIRFPDNPSLTSRKKYTSPLSTSPSFAPNLLNKAKGNNI